jgi:excisionase family DNA binding protein
MTIPSPHDQPTMSVVEAGALLGLGRASAYEAARTGRIPTIDLGGHRRRVPTAAMYELLHLTVTPRP